MIMEPIIDPVDVALIETELTPEKKLGDTNKGGNELYVVTWQDSPNTVKEIGRLREISSVAGDGMCIVRFQYNKSGRIIGQNIIYENEDTDAVYQGPRISFSYDEKGNRVKATIKSSDSPTETITYTDYQFDEAGNWISRKASGSGQSGSKIETRKITYYSK